MGRASRTKRERRSGTGDCYESAFLALREVPEQARPFVHLCHGTVTGNGGNVVGVRFGHAWIEIGGVVFDRSNGNDTMMPAERYYALGQITDVVRYEYSDALATALRHRTYGPWQGEFAYGQVLRTAEEAALDAYKARSEALYAQLTEGPEDPLAPPYDEDEREQMTEAHRLLGKAMEGEVRER